MINILVSHLSLAGKPAMILWWYLYEKLGREFHVFYDPAQSKAKTWVMTISETLVSHRRLIEARAAHQITCQKSHPSLCKRHPAVDTGLSLKEGRLEGQRQEWELWFNHQWGIKGLPGGAVTKDPPANARDTRDNGLNSGSGRPWEGMATHSRTLAWEFVTRGSWRATVHEAAKGQMWLSTCMEHQGLWSLTFWFSSECDAMGKVIQPPWALFPHLLSGINRVVASNI